MAVFDTATVTFRPGFTAAGAYDLEVETLELHCTVRASVLADVAGAGAGGSAGGAAAGAGVAAAGAAGSGPAHSELPTCPSNYRAERPYVELVREWSDSSITGVRISQLSDSGLVPAVPWLRYRVLRDGQLVIEGEVEFDYQVDEPNGTDCGYRYTAAETVNR